MNEFSISQIRETFLKDISDLQKAATAALAILVKTPADPAALYSLYRAGHSLKGLAGMVRATALENLGRDCSELSEIAHGFLPDEPNQARAVLIDLQALLPTWQQINIISAAEQTAVAEALYSASHRHFAHRWLEAGYAKKSIEPPMTKKSEPVETPAASPTSLPASTPPRVALPRLKKAATPVFSSSSFTPRLASVQRTTPALVTEEETPSDFQAELLASLCEEALLHAEAIEHATLLWEKGTERQEQIGTIQRAAHTLKGAANSVGQKDLGRRLHRLEDFFQRDLPLHTNPPPGLVRFFLRTVDALRLFVRDLEAKRATTWPEDWEEQLTALSDQLFQPEPKAATEEPLPNTADTSRLPLYQPRAATPLTDTKAEASMAHLVTIEETEKFLVRLEMGRLEKLLNLIGETITDRNRVITKLERLQTQFATLRQREQNLQEQIETFRQEFEFNLLANKSARSPDSLAPDGATEFSAVEFDRYDRFNILSRTLAEVANDIRETMQDMQDTVTLLFAENERFANTSRAFQGELTSLALLPVSVLHPRLERAFQDALREEGKSAVLEFHDTNAMVDKTVLDRIYAPLLHLIRNAVAHGIESPEERTRYKKSNLGHVTFTAWTEANRLFIEVRDDGFGVDEHAVQERAFSLGWIDAIIQPLSSADLLKFICRPNFSTAKQITTLSGRGIGMDVVRSAVEKLNGTLSLETVPREGTCWRLELPLSLAITESVWVEVSNQLFALPLLYIESGVLLDEPVIAPGDSSGTYQTEAFSCPAYRLADLLGLPVAKGFEQKQALFIRAGSDRALFLVDRLIDRSEIAVKTIGSLLDEHPFLSGASLDPEGRVVPILNLPSLRQSASKISAKHITLPQGVTTKHRAPTILVVDDSLSVRKAQQYIFSELGYHSIGAADGLEALDKIRQTNIDLIFTDLEMPRMHGYEFIQEIQANPLLKHIPMVVISSRSTEKYVNRALALGAKTFLGKPFSREQILPVLERYLPKVD